MGKYSIELRELVEGCFYDIFDFDYDFYTDDNNIRSNFERKFIQKYYFREIGFDTPQKFSWFLKAKLDELAPYYKELYRSQIEAMGYNFLENKNYTETYESIINNNNLRVDEIDKLLKGVNKNLGGDTSSVNDSTTNSTSTNSEQVSNANLNKSNNSTQTRDLISDTNSTDTKRSDVTTTDEAHNTRTDNLTETNTNSSRLSQSNINDGIANVDVTNAKTSDSKGEESLRKNNTGTVNDDTNSSSTTQNVENGTLTTTNTDRGTIKDSNTSIDTSNSSTTINDRIDNNIKSNKTVTTTTDRSNEFENTEDVRNTIKDEGQVIERRTLSGKGNIGVTSTSDLIKGWRSIIINIDQQLLNELNDLFMGLF